MLFYVETSMYVRSILLALGLRGAKMRLNLFFRWVLVGDLDDNWVLRRIIVMCIATLTWELISM